MSHNNYQTREKNKGKYYELNCPEINRLAGKPHDTVNVHILAFRTLKYDKSRSENFTPNECVY